MPALVQPHRFPTRAARVVLAAVLVAVFSALPARAERVIGPNQEQRVLALFAPAALGDEVVPGYRLVDVAIRSREIAVRLERSGGSDTPPGSLAFALRELGDPTPAGMVSTGETPSFAIVASGDLAPPERDALAALSARVRQNDDGGFWAEATFEAASPGDPAGGASWWLLLRWVALAGVIAALVVTLFVRRKRRPPPSENVE